MMFGWGDGDDEAPIDSADDPAGDLKAVALTLARLLAGAALVGVILLVLR